MRGRGAAVTNTQSDRVGGYWIRIILALLIFVLTAHVSAFAQQVNAQLTGVITDQTGAVIPGALVIITSPSNHDVYKVNTDSRGRYTFLALPAGSYQITVSRESFETLRRNFELTVDQHANMDFSMAIGKSTQVVTVSASQAPLVNATNSTVKTVLERTEIANLPLNGRNFASLITLTPGVSGVDTSQQGAGPSVQGQRNRDNSYSADGASIQRITFGGIDLTPPLDSIKEFSVQSVNGSAEFGSSGGGTVNLVTRSGTNVFHGEVYDYLRNNALDARSYFQTSLPNLHQNQFGFTFGGPFFIPKVLPRRLTKSYFFIAYEGFRAHHNQSSLGIVPTSAQLQGNFSGYNTIYNPFSTVPDPNNPGEYIRTPFPNNQIPLNMLNPVALAYAKAYLPKPNYSAPGIADNFINNNPAVNNSDTWMGRFDQSFGAKNQLFVRWLQNDSHSGSTLAVGDNLQAGNFAHPRNFSTQWNSTLTPTMLLTVGYGYDYSNLLNEGPFQSQFYNSSGWNNPDGFPVNEQGRPLLPGIGIAGYSTFLPQYYQPETVTGQAYTGKVQKIWGAHMIKAGFNWNHITSFTGDLNPYERFNPAQTQNPESPGGTGDGLASFLLGVPVQGGRLIGSPLIHVNWNYYGFYAQDTYRVNPRLTIDGGVRWDIAARFHTDGVLGSFNQATGDSWLLTGHVNIPGVAFQGPNVGAGIMNPAYHDISPRIGFAYRITPRRVLRAGYGRYFDTVAGRWQYVQNPRVSWPRALFQGTDAINESNVQVTILNPFLGEQDSVNVPNPFLTSSGAPAYPGGADITPHYLTPRVDEYNLALEQEITENMAATITYAGAVGHKLDCCGLVNQAYKNGPTPYHQAARPFPMMGIFRTNKNEGYSDYNALELKVQQRMSHGIAFLVTYTFSHSTDLGCSGYIGAEGCQVTQPYNLKADHADSAFDIRQIANITGVAALPFGHGRLFFNKNRAMDAIIGGWEVSGIFTFDSGLPLTPHVANPNQTNVGGGVSPRPDLVGSPYLRNPTRFEWFNTSAFQNPQGYDYGTAGRNILRGPNQYSQDLSIFKNFIMPPLSGHNIKIQYRADMFNAFNRVQWGNPDTTLGTRNFGVITSAGAGRIIQMALKVSF